MFGRHSVGGATVAKQNCDSLESRARFLLEVTKEVCANVLADESIFLSVSASDCVAKWAKEAGVDVIHVSSGGNTSQQKVSNAPGNQVPFAARIRKEVAGLAVIAVGTITGGKQAQEVSELEQTDFISAACIHLKYHSFALDAARELGVKAEYAREYMAAAFL